MLNQSKTAFQAEIDAACEEVIDFWPLQPVLRAGAARGAARVGPRELEPARVPRRLEGFVYAITPFNFTSIAGQPADRAGADGQHRDLEAGVVGDAVGVLHHAAAAGSGHAARVIKPRGGRSSMISRVLLSHRDLAGVHFTGSTEVFNSIVADDPAPNDVQLPLLPAHRSARRAEGLHRGAPVGRRAGAAVAIVRGG